MPAATSGSGARRSTSVPASPTSAASSSTAPAPVATGTVSARSSAVTAYARATATAAPCSTQVSSRSQGTGRAGRGRRGGGVSAPSTSADSSGAASGRPSVARWRGGVVVGGPGRSRRTGRSTITAERASARSIEGDRGQRQRPAGRPGDPVVRQQRQHRLGGEHGGEAGRAQPGHRGVTEGRPGWSTRKIDPAKTAPEEAPPIRSTAQSAYPASGTSSRPTAAMVSAVEVSPRRASTGGASSMSTVATSEHAQPGQGVHRAGGDRGEDHRGDAEQQRAEAERDVLHLAGGGLRRVLRVVRVEQSRWTRRRWRRVVVRAGWRGALSGHPGRRAGGGRRRAPAGPAAQHPAGAAGLLDPFLTGVREDVPLEQGGLHLGGDLPLLRAISASRAFISAIERSMLGQVLGPLRLVGAAVRADDGRLDLPPARGAPEGLHDTPPSGRPALWTSTVAACPERARISTVAGGVRGNKRSGRPWSGSSGRPYVSGRRLRGGPCRGTPSRPAVHSALVEAVAAVDDPLGRRPARPARPGRRCGTRPTR